VAEATCQIRQFPRPEDEKNDRENDEHFRQTDSTHVKASAAIVAAGLADLG
jgi:hypothetical protein